MVTKYDIFEFGYTKRSLIRPIEVVKAFNKNEEEYDSIHRYLSELVKDKLFVKKKKGFEVNITKESDYLYRIIRYCLFNGINYNLLLNKNIADFMSRALQKNTVTSSIVKVNPKTFKKYTETLERSGLLLKLSEKPLRAKVFYNSLVNNILVYFGYKHSVMEDDKNNYMKYIESELVKFNKLRKKDEEGYRQIIRDFQISFIHHSLSIEGNPITLNETRVILEKDIIPANLKIEHVDEVKNYQKAIAEMIKNVQEKKPLSVQVILSYHARAMQHRPEIAGKIRAKEVHIRNNPDFTVSKVEEIEHGLYELFLKYNEFIAKKTTIKETIDFAVYLHNQFQHIHPFEDGNSRTTRLVAFHLLQLKDIPVLDMPLGLLDEYILATKGSTKRDDAKLYQTLQKIILYNLKKINERL